MASARIYRTFGAGNQDKWTFSVWLKRAILGTTQKFFNCKQDASNYQYLSFNGSNGISYYNHYSSGSHGELVTSRTFLDTNAWYHIVFVYDSGNATSGDRTKLYVNGVRETAFSASSYPAQDQNGIINSANVHDIGSNVSAQYFDGCMSHVQFVDNQALAPTEFGEFDATSGEWKIKTDAYATPGTNGFFLKMEDRTNLDLDSSSNAHTFTTSGSITPTEDCPSNIFNTMTPQNIQSASGTFYYGNNEFDYNGDSTWRCLYSCISNSTGKYYFEMRCGSTADMFVGVIGTQDWKNTNGSAHNTATSYSMKSDGNLYNNNTSKAGGVSYTTNDIIGVALDLTNGAIWFAKNNVWTNSATIAEIAAGTTTNAAYTGITTGVGYQYGPCGEGKESANQDYNFGNGVFGNTIITSAGTNTSNIGLFEYDCPNGFTAWSTKGFNE